MNYQITCFDIFIIHAILFLNMFAKKFGVSLSVLDTLIKFLIIPEELISA